MKARVLTGAVIVLGLIVAVVGVVYAFGTPERPASPAGAIQASSVEGPGLPGSGPSDESFATDAAAGAIADSGGAEGGSMADSIGKVPADAKAPEADPSSPLAIEIPGCRCHSDDPKLVKQHEAYRMNQCAGCHMGQTPTGQ